MMRPVIHVSPSEVGLVVRLAVALATIVALDYGGLGQAGDAALRRIYYRARGARPSREHAILVAADEDTLKLWGAPPWGPERVTVLVDAIEHGRPRVIAFLQDPTRLAGPGVESTPSAGVLAGHTALEVTGAGPVERVRLRTAQGPTLTARILDEVGFRTDDGSLAVNFLGTRSAPTLPVHRVAAGEIPPAVFAGKIVLIGWVAEGLASFVPTPVGAMTADEVHAQAILAVTDGVAWRTPKRWLGWIVAGVVLVVALLAIRPFRPAARLLVVLGLAVALLLYDYYLFVKGTMLGGATRPLLVLIVASVISRAREKLVLRRHLADVRQSLGRRGALAEPTSMRHASDDAYWARVADRASRYVHCSSSILGGLTSDQCHLDLHTTVGAEPADIADHRRDVRRSPYRRACLTLTPAWHESFMAPHLDVRTLMVPLSEGSHLLGFWMLNFSRRSVVTSEHVSFVQALGRQLALAMERRGTSWTPPQRGRLAWFLSADPVKDDLDQIRVSAHTLAVSQRAFARLGESMPLPIMVATLWGEVRFANGAMKRLLPPGGKGGALAEEDLVALLSRLTGVSRESSFSALRRLLYHTQEITLAGPNHDFRLAWLPESSGDDRSERLVLVSAWSHSAVTVDAAATRSRPGDADGHGRQGLVKTGADPAAFDLSRTKRSPRS